MTMFFLKKIKKEWIKSLQKRGTGLIIKMDNEIIRLEKIYSDNLTLKLSIPLILIPIHDNNKIVFEIPHLNITSSGSTIDEAINKLQSDMVWLWKEYALEDDKNLSEDAIELKKYIKKLVSEAIEVREIT